VGENGPVSGQQSNQPMSPLRARINKASYPLMARLHAAPRLTLPGVTLALALIGAFAPAVVGVPALLLLAALLGWLGYLSWPVVGTSSRLLRVFAVLVIVLYAVSRMVG